MGTTFEVVFTVTLNPDVNGTSQSLSNQATVSAVALDEDGNRLTDLLGNSVTVTDESDSGTNPNSENGEESVTDGVFANDPTPILIADLGIAKSIVGEPVLTEFANFIVTYELTIANSGTVDLGSLSLIEDLATQFDSAFVEAGNLRLIAGPSEAGSSISINSADWNGETITELIDGMDSVLAVGDSFTIQLDVEINPAEVTAPLDNQAVGTGLAIDSQGNPILDSNNVQIVGIDFSDSGQDPTTTNPDDPTDTGSSSDPTPFDPPEVPLSEISGTIFLDANGDGFQQLGEGGIEGAEIILTGTDVFGDPVQITVLTDANGRFTFADLNAGNYTLTQTQPDGFADGIDRANPEFTVGNDSISNIQLGFGETFNGFSFGELQTGTSGRPPELGGLPAISSGRLSDLIDGFLGGPGPTYSGIPINSNSTPLTLESNRAISGGYSTAFSQGQGQGDDCGCTPEITPEFAPTPTTDDRYPDYIGDVEDTDESNLDSENVSQDQTVANDVQANNEDDQQTAASHQAPLASTESDTESTASADQNIERTDQGDQANTTIPTTGIFKKLMGWFNEMV